MHKKTLEGWGGVFSYDKQILSRDISDMLTSFHHFHSKFFGNDYNFIILTETLTLSVHLFMIKTRIFEPHTVIQTNMWAFLRQKGIISIERVQHFLISLYHSNRNVWASIITKQELSLFHTSTQSATHISLKTRWRKSIKHHTLNCCCPRSLEQLDQWNKCT